MEPEPDEDFIKIEQMTIDQFAGSLALVISSIGALLTIIWQSRCLCRCRVGLSDKCYIFDCSREPPPLDEEQATGKSKDKKDKSKNNNKNKDSVKPTESVEEQEETLVPATGSAEVDSDQQPSAEELRSLT